MNQFRLIILITLGTLVASCSDYIGQKREGLKPFHGEEQEAQESREEKPK